MLNQILHWSRFGTFVCLVTWICLSTLWCHFVHFVNVNIWIIVYLYWRSSCWCFQTFLWSWNPSTRVEKPWKWFFLPIRFWLEISLVCVCVCVYITKIKVLDLLAPFYRRFNLSGSFNFDCVRVRNALVCCAERRLWTWWRWGSDLFELRGRRWVARFQIRDPPAPKEIVGELLNSTQREYITVNIVHLNGSFGCETLFFMIFHWLFCVQCQ